MRCRPFAVLLAALAIASSARAAPPAVDLAVTGSIKVPDGRWDYASVDPASRTLFVGRGKGVMALDLASNRVTPLLIPGGHVHAVVVLPGGRLLSTNGDTQTATIADIATGRVIATIPTDKDPDSAVYDPASKLVFVIDGDAGAVTLVDPATGTSPGRIAIGGSLEYAVADGHGRIYINSESASELVVVDAAARRVVAHYPLTGCEHPSGLALDPARGVLLSVCRNGHAVAVRARDGAIVATLPIGRGPDAAIFDAKRRMFLVPCGIDGTLVAISARGGALSVVATIPTAPGARTGALDPRTGNVYLPAGEVSRDATGYHIAPGSVHVVIVGRPA